jgi:acyl-CoA dehydrogenase
MDMRTQLIAGAALLADVTARFDADADKAETIADLCLLKNHATSTMQLCADHAVHILGGMGFMRGSKSERIYREVKVMQIGGGATEIMKELAWRQLNL